MVGAPTMPYPTKNKNKEDSKGQGKEGKTIDIETLVVDFVGTVENLHEIRIHNVYEDKYRVNVWVKWIKEGMFGHSFLIEQSYFMQFSDGKLTDLTKEPSGTPTAW